MEVLVRYYPDPFRAAITHQFHLGIEYRRISDFINKDVESTSQVPLKPIKTKRIYKTKATGYARNEQARKEGFNE